MSVLYGKFEMPENIKIDKASPTFARFVAEPLERGFGHTVGNSLRRMMLSSLEAPAIIAIHIEGISHEYQAMDGIVEDMTNIVLNLKGALLARPSQEGESPRTQRVCTTTLEVTKEDLGSDGQYSVKLGDIIKSSDYEIVNPDLHIMTVTQPMKRRVDVRVASGRGYTPSERLEVEDKVVDEIVIDALFSPVRLVNYKVENTRVGQDTDFDKLILEVTTDGRISPQEALSYAAQIGVKHLDVFSKAEEEEVVFARETTAVNSDREEVVAKLGQKIDEIELSVRSTNCLNGAGIRYIGELAVMKESEMLQFRNFGKKSLSEIKAKLFELGLGFDMDLADHNITRENIVEIIETYLSEQQEVAAEGGE